MDQSSVQPDINQSAENIQIQSDSLVKSFNQGERKMPGKSLRVVFLIFLCVILGVVSGYFLNNRINRQGFSGSQLASGTNEGALKKGLTVGSEDESTFKDSTEGKLEKGGIDGEGSHHLVRPGGDSQTVYLTSSIIDLDQYAGHQVKIWGETHTAQKAGWFMDVGRLEILD
jgi:hypothetical protein